MKELLVRKSSLLRGLLSLFFLMAMVGNVWGDTATSTSLSSKTTDAQTVEEGKTITYKCSGKNNYENPARIYKNSTFTISGTNGETITKIEITTPSDNPATGFTANVGNYEASATAGTWTGSASSVVFNAATAQVRVSSITVTYTADANTASAPTLTSSCTFTSASMDATITNNETGATVYYTTDGTAPTTSSSSFTGASKTINITATTTVKAMAVVSGKTNSAVATATYTKAESIANTAETAYTVAEAIALIDANSSLLATTKVYVKGIVSEVVTAFNASYGNISFNVSADGNTDGQQFQFFRNQLNENDKYTEDPNIVPGGTVIGYGLLTKYNSTYEFKAGNYNVSYTAPAVIKSTATLTLSTYKNALTTGFDDEYTITYDGDATVTATSSDPTVASATLADGKVTISAIKAGKTTITIAAAETDNYYAANKSYTLTVTDPTPAAELPFSFDKGKADIAEETGMTQYGLSTDYSSSPKLKFDGAGDYVIINYSSSAKNVSYKLKGNNTDENTVFDVLESADGKTYTTVHSFAGTDVPSNATSYTDLLKADSRYVKFVYTTKGGNVALGAITISNEKADAGLAFDKETYRFFSTDTKSVKATSTQGSTGAITYALTEGDGNKFTIYNAGNINCTTVGSYTVTATIAETEDYKAGTATCTVLVKAPVVANSIIVGATEDGKYFAMTNTANGSSSSTYIESVQIAKIGNKYYVGDNLEAIKYCTTTTDGKTTIVAANGQYLQATDAKNVSFTDEEYEWTNAEGVLTAVDAEKHGTLQYNVSNPRFTTYTSKSGQYAQIVSLDDVSTDNTYERNATEGKYGTICLPLAVEEGQYTGAEFYTATLGEDLVMLEAVTALEAGKPYIYKANGSVITVALSGTPAGATKNGPLTGILVDTTVPVGEYVLQTKGGVQKFYQVAESAQPKLSANKAYLTVPAASASDVKAFSLAEGGNETALKTIEALTNNNAKIYDINGRELKTLQKGINIVNGVKVLVK